LPNTKNIKHKVIEKELDKYIDENSDSEYQYISKCFKPAKNDSSDSNEYDFNTSHCIPVKHIADKCKNNCNNEKNQNIYNDEFVKLSTYKIEKESEIYSKYENFKPSKIDTHKVCETESETDTSQQHSKINVFDNYCYEYKHSKNNKDSSDSDSENKCNCGHDDNNSNSNSDDKYTKNSSSDNHKNNELSNVSSDDYEIKIKCKNISTSNSNSCVETNEIDDRIKK